MSDDRVSSIAFANGNQAVVVRARPREAAAALVEAAGIEQDSPVLLIVGGADSLDTAGSRRLDALFEMGVASALEATRAVIVDGGTDAGVMAIAGDVLGDAGLSFTHVGVAPSGRVSVDGRAAAAGESPLTNLEPHHSHFILAASDDWGGETRLLLEVVEAIAGRRPVAVLLAGGGAMARSEVLGAAARGWPIAIVAGTGGLADSLVRAYRGSEPGSNAAADREIPAIVDQAILSIVGPDDDPAILERELARRLAPDATLMMAWQRYHALSTASRQQQRSFRWIQTTILGLGVAVTTLVVIQIALQRAGALPDGTPAATAIHYAIVLIPITVAALLAMAARSRPGTRWVELRGAAETIKRETYRYRARVGRYAPGRSRASSREVKLAEYVGSTMNRLMRTDVNLLALDQPVGDPASAHTAVGDDGYQPLTPDAYIRFRIDDQIRYYQANVARRRRQVIALRWIMLGVGGLGTLLAAALLEPWVAVTTAIVGAGATYLEAMQLESTITLQNQAATDLGAARAWWNALSPQDQVRHERFDTFVNHAERVMGAEHAGWIQEMQDAITQLRLETNSGPVTEGTGGEPDGHDSGAEPPPSTLAPRKDPSRPGRSVRRSDSTTARRSPPTPG